MLSNQITRAWALTGIAILFMQAIVRLGERAFLTIDAGLSAVEWGALGLVTASFLYFEAWRGIQGRYAPMVAARLRALDGDRRISMRLLAPLYAMALVGGSRGQLVRAWLGMAAIVGAVLIVRALPEPWRGIIDFAVAAALLWGLIAIIIVVLGDGTRVGVRDRTAA